MKHELKLLPAYFEAVLAGEKTFEIRDNTDRGFQKGDALTLREFDPRKSINDEICYTGRQTEKLVSYVSNFEQKPGFVVLGLKQSETEADEMRTCLDAAVLEIEDLNKDIEKLRQLHGESGKAAIMACANHIQEAWEHGFIDRSEQDMLDVTTAIRNFAETYQGGAA